MAKSAARNGREDEADVTAEIEDGAAQRKSRHDSDTAEPSQVSRRHPLLDLPASRFQFSYNWPAFSASID
jgi:hypothetical protein